jgi:predicted GNAT family N-acyltransferase
MKILQASTESEYQEITQFFWKIWKEEFNLERFDRINEYKQWTVFYIEINSKIVSVINIRDFRNTKHIWRFGTIKEYRWKWYWWKLMNYTLNYLQNNWETKVSLDADHKRTALYEKYWFKQVGEKIAVWNTYWIKMIKDI